MPKTAILGSGIAGISAGYHLKQKGEDVVIYEKENDNKYICDAAAQIPVMLLNAALDAPNVYCVLSDDYTSMYDATMHMIHSGIKDILYFYNFNRNIII